MAHNCKLAALSGHVVPVSLSHSELTAEHMAHEDGRLTIGTRTYEIASRRVPTSSQHTVWLEDVT